jgi:hypothetical protein
MIASFFYFRTSTSEFSADFFNSILRFTRCRASLSGRCPVEAVDARNVYRASIADKYPALAYGPPREIFEKASRDGLKLYVARSKARSSESMLVPY